MRKTTKLHLILLSISVLMLVFFVSVVRANSRSFVTGSMQEVVENVNLGVSDQVVGNLSVSDGSIDFFISNPDGVTIQEFLNVSNLNFNFVADKNGTYAMRLNNTYQAFAVTVELDYGVNRTFVFQEVSNFGSSLGVAHVGPPIIQPPPPDMEDDEPTDYLFEPYFNFLKAADILKTATNARTILPIRNVTLMNCIASIVGLTIILNPRWRRSDFQAHARHLLASLR